MPGPGDTAFTAEFEKRRDTLHPRESHVRNLDWGHRKDIFSTIYQNQYAPIATLIMAIEVEVFGATPAPLKAVGVLLHIVNRSVRAPAPSISIGRTFINARAAKRKRSTMRSELNSSALRWIRSISTVSTKPSLS